MILPKLQSIPRDVKFITRFLRAVRDVNVVQKNNQTVGQLFQQVARQNEGKPCFYYDDDVWTYKRVEEESNRIGNYFSEHGLTKGNVVSLFMGNRIEVVLTWLGLSKIGVVPALVNFNLTSTPLKHSVECVKPKAIICGYELSKTLEAVYRDGAPHIPIFGSGLGDRTFCPSTIDMDKDLKKVSSLPPTPSSEVGFNDDLFYIYTSGTTGLPKAAVIKHSRFIMIGYGLRRIMGLKPSDRFYTTFPLQHIAGGIIAVGFAVLSGMPVLMRQKFSASEFWKDCAKYNITGAQYMGEICRYLLKQSESEADKAHSLRMMFGNGLRPELWTEFEQRFKIPLIIEMYGATEGNCNLFNIVGHKGAIGFVSPILQKYYPINIIKIDENDEPVRDKKTGLVLKAKPHEVGEVVGKIVVGTPGREYNGYVGDEEASKKKVLKNVNKKGDTFFRTGDVATRDERGFYFFKDRIGDSFRWKSENVSTAQVEGVISSLTKLNDVVVYPVKIAGADGSAGMVAIADPDAHLNLDRLANELVESLPSYARPLFLRIVTEMELTETHKLKKMTLKKDGYDLRRLGNDRVYFYNGGKFTPLTQELVTEINNGKIKL